MIIIKRINNQYFIKENYVIIKVFRNNLENGIREYDVLVDLDDFERIKSTNKNLNIYFNTNGYAYARIVIKNKVYPLHRYLLNYDGNLVVDHINNHTLDCRKENLRVVDIPKNGSNVKRNGNTDVKGIIRDGNYYIASKTFNGFIFSKKCLSMKKAKEAMDEIDRLVLFYINNNYETSNN